MQRVHSDSLQRIIKHKNGDLEICEVIFGIDDERPEGYGWTDANVFASHEEKPSPMESLSMQVGWFKAALVKPSLPATGCDKTCCAEKQAGGS